jgi:hypothetical protein
MHGIAMYEDIFDRERWYQMCLNRDIKYPLKNVKNSGIKNVQKEESKMFKTAESKNVDG